MNKNNNKKLIESLNLKEASSYNYLNKDMDTSKQSTSENHSEGFKRLMVRSKLSNKKDYFFLLLLFFFFLHISFKFVASFRGNWTQCNGNFTNIWTFELYFTYRKCQLQRNFFKNSFHWGKIPYIGKKNIQYPTKNLISENFLSQKSVGNDLKAVGVSATSHWKYLHQKRFRIECQHFNWIKCWESEASARFFREIYVSKIIWLAS